MQEAKFARAGFQAVSPAHTLCQHGVRQRFSRSRWAVHLIGRLFGCVLALLVASPTLAGQLVYIADLDTPCVFELYLTEVTPAGHTVVSTPPVKLNAPLAVPDDDPCEPLIFVHGVSIAYVPFTNGVIYNVRTAPSGVSEIFAVRVDTPGEAVRLRGCCKIPHAKRLSNSRIILIWIIASLLTVNLS